MMYGLVLKFDEQKLDEIWTRITAKVVITVHNYVTVTKYKSIIKSSAPLRPVIAVTFLRLWRLCAQFILYSQNNFIVK